MTTTLTPLIVWCTLWLNCISWPGWLMLHFKAIGLWSRGSIPKQRWAMLYSWGKYRWYTKQTLLTTSEPNSAMWIYKLKKLEVKITRRQITSQSNNWSCLRRNKYWIPSYPNQNCAFWCLSSEGYFLCSPRYSIIWRYSPGISVLAGPWGKQSALNWTVYKVEWFVRNRSRQPVNQPSQSFRIKSTPPW